jgi:hypothetical protein
MTALRHHPHGETLMSHAAGALDPALSVVLRCHLQFCERCRAHLRALDNVGGAFLEGLKAPEDEDFFARTKDRFAGVFAQEAGSVLPPIALDPYNEVPMPAPLARATGLRRETIPWIKMPHIMGSASSTCQNLWRSGGFAHRPYRAGRHTSFGKTWRPAYRRPIGRLRLRWRSLRARRPSRRQQKRLQDF